MRSIENVISTEHLTKIDEGGMGEIFYRNDSGDHPTIVKRLKPASEASLIYYFQKEAFLTSLIDHPNIVSFVSFHIEDQVPQIELEYINGILLNDLYRSLAKLNQTCPLDILFTIIRSLLVAVDYLHHFKVDRRTFSIVHRDISPHNVMLSQEGRVKLIDFGISSFAAEHLHDPLVLQAGKGLYSPVFSKTSTDCATSADLYSIGIVLLEGLLGREHLVIMNKFNLFNDKDRLSRYLGQLDILDRELIGLVLSLLFAKATSRTFYRRLIEKCNCRVVATEEDIASFCREIQSQAEHSADATVYDLKMTVTAERG